MSAFQPAVAGATPDGLLVPNRTRFAPSPTGPLHLGHVAAMIFVWGLAGRRQASVDVRIEDHDRQRCRPEFTQQLLADLRWLGFEPLLAGCWSKQSDHPDRFEAALQRLRDRGLVYACGCSRRVLGTAAEAAEACYPGTCRDRGLAESPETALRVRLPDEPVKFTDLRRGEQCQHPARQCGDLVVRDRNGNWTYQFAVVVDDLHDGIDWVIRGDDLLASTGRQILLGRLLGRTQPPLWEHHPLILGVDGRKLSKSDGATPLAALRQAGRSSADVIGLAAQRVGLQREAAPLKAGEVHRLFEVPQVATPRCFD